MLSLQYENLDKILTKGIREIIVYNEPDYVQGLNWYYHDLHISSNSIECTIDIGNYFYTMNKWKQLLRLYVDNEKFKEFIEILKNSKSYSQTFYFNQKARTVGSGNGSCLIALVVTRGKRTQKFNKATLLYRTTVITKQFVCDLVLLNRMCQILNQNGCEIQEASFYCPVASLNAFHTALYYKNFKFNVSKYRGNEFCDKTLVWIEEYFPGNKVTKYKSFDRLIRYRNENKQVSIPIQSLNIF